MIHTTPGQSGPGSDSIKGVLYIPQSSTITRDSPSDYLMSYTGHSLGGGSLTHGVLYYRLLHSTHKSLDWRPVLLKGEN